MDDHGRDLYLRRKYGITLDEYNAMLEKQGGVCAICQSQKVTKSLAVDHDHKNKTVKIHTEKADNTWAAFANYNGTRFGVAGDSKSGVIRAVRLQLLRASVRGILCFNCNRGLRPFSDNPLRLQLAAHYLSRFQNSGI